MSSKFFKLVFLFILVSFLNFSTTEAEDLNYFDHFCSENTTTVNSTYQANRKTLFASLSSKATVKTFYNNTVGGAVYGLFMCRGDVPPQLCGQCVINATQTLSSDCYLSTWAVIWHDECMVRYSNSSFFSTVDTGPPSAVFWSNAVVSNQASFMSLLYDTMNKTTNEAALSHNGDRYATKEAMVSENQTLYCLAQCTQDLSPLDCSYCLAHAAAEIPRCCGDKQGGRVMLPSCNVRYESYPFYSANAPRQGGLVPATKYSKPESYYLSQECSSYESSYSDFEEKLKILFSYLVSNATIGSNNNGFYKADVDGRVFGLFMCRVDIPPHLCGQCVVNATHRVASECPSSMGAIFWYNHCLLRYDEETFFYKISTSPRFEDLNVTNVNNVESSFKFTRLSNLLAEVDHGTTDSDERYRMKSFALNEHQTIYILAQCTQDLSGDDCVSCLEDVVGSGIPWSRLGSVGGRVLYPSCTLRFELFKFYSDGTEGHAPSPLILPPPSTPAGERKNRSREIILIAVPIVIMVTLSLFSFCWYLLRKKARKNSKTILKENFGHESTTVEPLQFDLVVIKVATNNFSHENRIGKGGFGVVYKGVLLDGQHIAAKRLSKSSKQGIVEFKNEVLLIAKLQHRNLVAFIGFCLEEQEKILIYEYVPNKSLDYFLFDARLEKLLSWSKRHKIIEGIARGILYLHEHSRLKVIHRDLKPSNILLDENMNPKISDFGLARIVEVDQQQGSTNKVVGTFGYMSPEYAMQGKFSDKSDVFSFGVMVLEIITGKKNVGYYESHHGADSLLSSMWRQYRNETTLSMLDPKMKENCSIFEVLRCIQIGLLCVQENPHDRPTMMTVVSGLSNHSIELPSPREPAFYLHDEVEQNIVARISNSTSINEMSISNFLQR